MSGLGQQKTTALPDGRIVGVHNGDRQKASNFGVDELVHAAQHGDFPFIENAVENFNISPSTTDSDGCSLLHWASINNRVSIVNFLLSKNVNINYTGGANNETALQWAVRSTRSAELVSIFLSHEADLTHKSKYGLDALFIAVQAGNMSIVYLLLVAGADPNTLSADMDTPLLWLLKSKNTPRCNEIMRLLLTFNANANAGDREKNTVLHLLAKRSLPNSKLAFLFHKNGARVDALNKDYMTPYDIAKEARNVDMGMIFHDLQNYEIMPDELPIVIFAGIMLVGFMSFHLFSWYFVVFLVWPFCAVVFRFYGQGSIELRDSRMICGYSWGTMICIFANHYTNVASFVSTQATIVIYTVALGVIYYLYTSMKIVPAGVAPHDAHSRANLADKIARSNTISSGGDGLSTINICPTCLVDKSLVSTHCSQCDRCVVALDHHCPFVNNCVGRGNRRNFVFFTMFACMGCFGGAYLPLIAEYGTYCADVPRGTFLATFFKIQQCAFRIDISLAVVPWLAALSCIWIFFLFASQLALIAKESTTYEEINHRDNEIAPISVRGCKNLYSFCLTGQYTLTVGRSVSTKGSRRTTSNSSSSSTSSKALADAAADAHAHGTSAVSTGTVSNHTAAAAAAAASVDLEDQMMAQHTNNREQELAPLLLRV